MQGIAARLRVLDLHDFKQQELSIIVWAFAVFGASLAAWFCLAPPRHGYDGSAWFDCVRQQAVYPVPCPAMVVMHVIASWNMACRLQPLTANLRELMLLEPAAALCRQQGHGDHRRHHRDDAGEGRRHLLPAGAVQRGVELRHPGALQRALPAGTHPRCGPTGVGAPAGRFMLASASRRVSDCLMVMAIAACTLQKFANTTEVSRNQFHAMQSGHGTHPTCRRWRTIWWCGIVSTARRG